MCTGRLYVIDDKWVIRRKTKSDRKSYDLDPRSPKWPKSKVAYL